MIRRFLLLFCMGLVFTALVPRHAHADDAKQKLQQVESELDQRKQKEAALNAEAQRASETLKPLQQRLIAATEALNAKQDEEQNLEDKLDDLNADIDSKTKQMQEEKHKLILLTDALIELSREPPAELLLQTGLTLDSIHRTILLRSVLPNIHEATDTIAHDLAALNDLKAEADRQQQRVAAVEANLQAQRGDLDQLVRTRQGLLQRTEKEREETAAELVSLASQAQDLRQLLAQLAPRHGGKAQPEPEGLSPALKWPVAGRIIHSYGDRDADGVTSDGVSFAASSAAPVVAPRAGRVVFVGPFKGYGQIIILQHGGGYHSFLAGLGRIDAEMGQEVETGEPLGVMPLDAKGHPQLYFEWRRNNEPVNPAAFKP